MVPGHPPCALCSLISLRLILRPFASFLTSGFLPLGPSPVATGLFLNLFSLCSCQGAFRVESAASMVATPHCGARSLSADLTSDESSRAAGHQRFTPENDTEFFALEEQFLFLLHPSLSLRILRTSVDIRFASLTLLFPGCRFRFIRSTLGP